jgi:hypothetical protein
LNEDVVDFCVTVETNTAAPVEYTVLNVVVRSNVVVVAVPLLVSNAVLIAVAVWYAVDLDVVTPGVVS